MSVGALPGTSYGWPCLLLLNRRNMTPKAIPIAIIPTPVPIPALAPVDRPLSEVEVDVGGPVDVSKVEVGPVVGGGEVVGADVVNLSDDCCHIGTPSTQMIKGSLARNEVIVDDKSAVLVQIPPKSVVGSKNSMTVAPENSEVQMWL